MPLQFLGAHPVEQVIQRDAFGAVNPFTSRIDLGTGLQRNDHGGSGHVHLSRFFDDSLQRHPDISLGLLEEFQRVSVRYTVQIIPP